MMKNWLHNVIYFKNSEKVSLKTIFFLSVIIILIPKNIFIFSTPRIGLDPSWILAINMALKEGLIWGQDIIFTYGPLGFLSTRLAENAYSFPIIVFYLFTLCNGVYFIHFIFNHINKKEELIFSSTILILNGHFLFRTDTITLYFFALFYMFLFLKSKNYIYIALVSMISIVSLFIKLNTGIIANIVFYIFILYCLFYTSFSKLKIIGISSAHLFFILLLSYLLKVDLSAYIANSMPIINSYNDAMAISHISNDFLIIAGFMFLLLFIPYLISINKLIRSPNDLFLLFNISLIVFIIFKQSFVRADISHVFIFFTSISFVAFIAYFFTNDSKVKSFLYYSIIAIGILSITNPGGFNIINKFSVKLSSPDNSKIVESITLPQNILDKIGNKSVDALGYEASFVFFNNLKYNPRPVFQSYSAYDPRLININFEKYNSKNAPDFVMYHFGSIDGRHPFWDEPKVFLSILSNYTIVDTFSQAKLDFPLDRLILFKKNTTSKNIVPKIIKNTTVQLNSYIKIPKSDDIIFMIAEIDYNTIGNIRRFLYQPSPLYIDKIYNNQTMSNHRLILPVMKSGVPINKKILDFENAYSFFATAGKEYTSTDSVMIKGNPNWFNNKIKIKFIEYKISD